LELKERLSQIDPVVYSIQSHFNNLKLPSLPRR
jgi:hypothetical protein